MSAARRAARQTGGQQDLQPRTARHLRGGHRTVEPRLDHVDRVRGIEELRSSGRPRRVAAFRKAAAQHATAQRVRSLRGVARLFAARRTPLRAGNEHRADSAAARAEAARGGVHRQRRRVLQQTHPHARVACQLFRRAVARHLVPGADVAGGSRLPTAAHHQTSEGVCVGAQGSVQPPRRVEPDGAAVPRQCDRCVVQRGEPEADLRQQRAARTQNQSCATGQTRGRPGRRVSRPHVDHAHLHRHRGRRVRLHRAPHVVAAAGSHDGGPETGRHRTGRTRERTRVQTRGKRSCVGDRAGISERDCAAPRRCRPRGVAGDDPCERVDA